MSLSFFIAKRYLFSKKSVNAIHIISGISMLGVFVGSAALIILLSAFNGFGDLTLSLYNKFSSELRIEPLTGKTFDPTNPYLRALKNDHRVINYSEVLQEKVLLHYGNVQCIGLIKGVSDNYFKDKPLDHLLLEGELTLKNKGTNFAIIGSDVQNRLSVNIKDDFQHIEVYAPKKGVSDSPDPSSEFSTRAIHPIAVFEPQQHVDNIILVPLDFARDLLDEQKRVSAIELNLKQGISIDNFRKEIAVKLGENFQVKNRAQQNQLLYKIINSEKWAVFLILTFVLIIAIFNIIGSLTMLVIDKRKDIAVLSSLGANKALIRKIFFIEGMMIAMIGCILGMLTALLICLLQQRYGFVKMGAANFFTEAYPISLKGSDFILVFATVASISILASLISSRLSIQHTQNLREDL